MKTRRIDFAVPLKFVYTKRTTVKADRIVFSVETTPVVSPLERSGFVYLLYLIFWNRSFMVG